MIDKQLEQLILLGVPEVDRWLVIQYLSGRDFNAVKIILDKNIENNIYTEATQTLKAFVDSKVKLYNELFTEVPFEEISVNIKVTDNEESS